MRKNSKLNPAGIAIIISSLLMCVFQPLGEGTIQQYIANAICIFGGIPCGIALTNVVRTLGKAWMETD